MNVIAAQQDLILEKITKSEERFKAVIEGLKTDRKCNCNDLKSLKDDFLEMKNDILKHVDLKIDNLITGENFSPAPQVNQKKKLLFMGDSLSRNLNISVLKNVTDMEVTRVEAFNVSDKDPNAKFPEKNLTKNLPKELSKDIFSTLILQGGTNEVSNLDVKGNALERIEAMKKEIKACSEGIFTLAEESLAKNQKLENVIIFKRMFRCDTLLNDPLQIRSKLSEYGNRVLEDTWLTRGCPKNISIVLQPLECDGDLRLSRFGNPNLRGYDGVHMRGGLAVQHYTGSVINAVLDVLSPKATNQGDENITKVNLGQPLYRCGTAPQAPGNKFTHHTQRPTQVNVNAENVRKTGSPQHFHNMQNNIPAQPLLDSVYPQMPGQYVNSQHNQQYRPGHNSSATGANRAPVWVSESYNIRTQNRFSAVSGN